MNNIYLFNKTVRGYSHITHQTPCEDNSGSIKNEFYNIFVIADGHGDNTCFRSSIGSKLVVESAIEKFQEFAKLYEKDKKKLEDLLEKNGEVVKKLAQSIVILWNKKVEYDLSQNKVKSEEIKKYCEEGSDTYELYMSGKCLNHIYGTTLIAGLQIFDYLILVQQGDGRCIVFYEDGKVNQPIPWDERCETNVTTSMCDVDAIESIRYCILNNNQKLIAACFVGSDGIEDAYSNMEGTHCFYRQISLELLKNKKNFDKFIEKALSDLSQYRSSDDMSVSGIVDLKLIKNLKSNFETKIKQYDLLAEKDRIESIIRSKSRKYDFLFKQKEEYDNKLKKFEEKINQTKIEINELEINKNELEKNIDSNLIFSKSMKLRKKLNLFRIKKNEIQDVYDEDEFGEKENIEKQSNIKIIDEELRIKQKQLDELIRQEQEFKKQNESTYLEFLEFDSQYKSLQEQYRIILNQIDFS